MAILSDDELRDEIFRREPVDGVRIVGVDGPSGGGESTLARRLADLTSAPLIEIDD